jgi:hypothetical protein
MTNNPTTCFPTKPPINPLRLASNYRDYWGNADARLTELTDPLLDAACYVPRIYHAPGTEEELAGVGPRDYMEYALALPPGSFIVGYMHTYTSLANAADADNPPVRSSFRFQLTDVHKQYRFFEKPVPEAWLLNDAPSSNAQSPVGAGLYVLNPSPRLLTALYPVTPPGMFKVEFWNTLDTLNTGVRLSLLLAVPDEDLQGRGA